MTEPSGEEFAVWADEAEQWLRASDLLAAEWIGQVRSWDEVDFEFTDDD